MIKINKDFDRVQVDKNNQNSLLYSYYEFIFEVFQKKYNGHVLKQKINIIGDDFEFQFLPHVINPKTNKPYMISFKKLTTGSREEVFAIDGIDFYMDICRLKSCAKSKYTEADFIEQLYHVFPEDITMAYNDSGEKYYSIEDKGDVYVREGYNPSVSNFAIISDYIETKIRSYDTGYFSYYSSRARLNLLNCKKNKRKPFSLTSEITFEEIKDYLNLMHDDVISFLETNIRKKDKNQVFINYDDMDDDMRHELLNHLGIKTCPYCNRQYITSWPSPSKRRTTADLDHYYPKSLFPLFSLSSFNFIPSCHVCNSLIKGDRFFETLYPYEESAEESVRFDIGIKKGKEPKDIVDIWLGKGRDSLPEIQNISELIIENICTDEFRKKLIDNELELFRLKTLYKNHLDEAINVFLILRIYLEKDFYKNNINNICDRIGIKGGDKDSMITKEELKGFLLGMVSDGQGLADKPLSKMISDIYNREVENTISK